MTVQLAAASDGLICCAVGSRQFAFRAGDVRHVARVEHMRSDAAEDGRAGVLKINGQQVPVFSLGRLLGETAAIGASPDQHIAVTGGIGDMVGWLVDRIARAPIADASTIVPLPAIVGGAATAWFDALVNVDGTTVLRLSPHNLRSSSGRPAERDGSFQPAPSTARPAEPLVVLFSTPALPASDVRRYAISAKLIAAISQPLPIVTVPGSASYVAGVSWWRNGVVPVIDFRDRESRATELQGRWLLARAGWQLGGALIAMPIDPDIAVYKPSAADESVAVTNVPAFTAGLFRAGADTVALLDLDTLLGL